MLQTVILPLKLLFHTAAIHMYILHFIGFDHTIFIYFLSFLVITPFSHLTSYKYSFAAGVLSSVYSVEFSHLGKSGIFTLSPAHIKKNATKNMPETRFKRTTRTTPNAAKTQLNITANSNSAQTWLRSADGN